MHVLITGSSSGIAITAVFWLLRVLPNRWFAAITERLRLRRRQ